MSGSMHPLGKSNQFVDNFVMHVSLSSSSSNSSYIISLYHHLFFLAHVIHNIFRYLSITACYTDKWEAWWKNPEEVRSSPFFYLSYPLFFTFSAFSSYFLLLHLIPNISLHDTLSRFSSTSSWPKTTFPFIPLSFPAVSLELRTTTPYSTTSVQLVTLS